MSKVDMQEINVLDIYLDPENPRHESTKEQDKIIELLLTEQVLPLAKDIAKNGTNPLELMGVFKDDSGRYIALEGNRRLCALTLLNDPNLAPSNYKKQFQELSKEHSIPSTISAVVFESRESANIWLERRHTGQQGGIGVKDWNPSQQTRFNTRNQRADDNALALGLIEYASKQGLISESDVKKRLTTATRYLGNPFFRKTLGIVSKRNNPDIELNVPIEDFNKGIKKFFEDLIENKEVNSRTKSNDWQAYAKKLSREGYAPENHTTKYPLSNPPKLEQENEPEKSNQQDKKSPIRDQRHPNDRRYLISTSFNTKITNTILLKIYKDIKNINVDDYPLAIALLSRIFLENIYQYFYIKLVGSPHTGKTHEVLNKVIKLIEKDTSLTKEQKNALGALKRVQQNANNILSPNTLGAFAHGGHYPQPNELKSEWDNIQAIIEYMLDKIK